MGKALYSVHQRPASHGYSIILYCSDIPPTWLCDSFTHPVVMGMKQTCKVQHYQNISFSSVSKGVITTN